MTSAYLWVKALHVIFAASWFAGLFYLPRILVNLAMVDPASQAERERLLLMARKLHRFSLILMWPALLLGLWLWLGFDLWRGMGWVHAKLALVLATIGFQHGSRSLLRRFETGGIRRSHVWFRFYNEISVLLFAGIVILAVVKPF